MWEGSQSGRHLSTERGVRTPQPGCGFSPRPQATYRQAVGKGIEVDFEHWPVVVSTAPHGAARDADLTDYLRRYAEELDRRSGRYVAVVDLRAGGALSARQRRLLVEAMATEEVGAQCVGIALVFQSRVMRGMLSAILWMREPVYPTRVFANVADAVDWGRALCATGRTPATLPPRRDAL